MAVKIGSARIDERGKAQGGQAGDQTGKELSTQAWYKHKKGWYVLRAKDLQKSELIAVCMENACANKLIGYDQSQRLTLYNAVKQHGFDVNELTKAVETDCSALVRVCCAYAGITVGNFSTINEKAMLMSTGAFYLLEGSKYESSADYLARGDILVTKTKGHTAVVLNDGSNVETLRYLDYELGDRQLYNGLHGDDVQELQQRLIEMGYSCGDWGADGDFGDATEMAVHYFQDEHGLSGTGVADFATIKAIIAESDDETDHAYLKIVGGNCWFREQPSKNGRQICALMRGTDLKMIERLEGWYKARMIDGGAEGYVSSKYAKEVDGL